MLYPRRQSCNYAHERNAVICRGGRTDGPELSDYPKVIIGSGEQVKITDTVRGRNLLHRRGESEILRYHVVNNAVRRTYGHIIIGDINVERLERLRRACEYRKVNWRSPRDQAGRVRVPAAELKGTQVLRLLVKGLLRLLAF